MQNTNKKLFEETPVPQAVQTMMIPTIIGALVTVLYSLADTLFVGMMNDQIQNAAVALAAPALLAFNAVINLFGIGSSSMMSRALGRGDLKTVCASASLGFYGTVVSGALLSALCYIFMQPFVVLLGGDINTAAFFILPWGLGMGAAGAGLATFLSNCFACCYFFVLLMVRKKKTNINLNPKYLSLTKEIVFGVMEVGIPAAIQNLSGILLCKQK